METGGADFKQALESDRGGIPKAFSSGSPHSQLPKLHPGMTRTTGHRDTRVRSVFASPRDKSTETAHKEKSEVDLKKKKMALIDTKARKPRWLGPCGTHMS